MSSHPVPTPDLDAAVDGGDICCSVCPPFLAVSSIPFLCYCCHLRLQFPCLLAPSQAPPCCPLPPRSHPRPLRLLPAPPSLFLSPDPPLLAGSSPSTDGPSFWSTPSNRDFAPQIPPRSLCSALVTPSSPHSFDVLPLLPALNPPKPEELTSQN